MIGPSTIIPNGLGGVPPEEDRARVLHFVQQLIRSFHRQHKMLWCHHVRYLNRLRKISHPNKGPASSERLADNGSSIHSR